MYEGDTEQDEADTGEGDAVMAERKIEKWCLKPCPFCGETPYSGGFPDYRIECLKCHQSIVKAAWFDGDLGTMEASWNTRIGGGLSSTL